jgi:intracellular multiplication protein IcmM
MSRGKWNRIKQSKFFYVRIYRKVSTWLILSLLLNVLLCFSLIYSYLHKPIRTYYATSGITSPIELNALDAPNQTSEALLPPDPISENETKLIPD